MGQPEDSLRPKRAVDEMNNLKRGAGCHKCDRQRIRLFWVSESNEITEKRVTLLMLRSFGLL